MMFSLHILLGRVCSMIGLQDRVLPIAKRKSDGAHYDFTFQRTSKQIDVQAMTYLQHLLNTITINGGGGDLIPILVEVLP
jgi:hypothetical protein